MQSDWWGELVRFFPGASILLFRFRPFRVLLAGNMEFSISEIIVWLVVGALTGPVVGMLVKRNRDGFGRWRNLGVGLVGALLGGGLFKLFRVDLGLGSLAISLQDLVAAFLGALLFLLAVFFIQRKRG